MNCRLLQNSFSCPAKAHLPVDTGRKLNVHKRFRRRQGRAGKVSVVTVIDQQYNLVSSSKGNIMVKTKKIKNVQLSLFLSVKL